MYKKLYYKHLSRVQNGYPSQDIMTITGLMPDREKIKHLKRYAEYVGDTKAISFCNNYIRFYDNKGRRDMLNK